MDTPERNEVRQALNKLKPVLNAYLLSIGLLPIAAHCSMPSRAPDVQFLLRRVLDSWNDHLHFRLPRSVRTYTHELIEVRNRWAHEEPFSKRDAARARDTVDQMVFALTGKELSPQPAVRMVSSMPVPVAGQSQRDVMRAIHRRCAGDGEQTVREYAAAERKGLVSRKSNSHGLSPEDYARALLKDGEKKGWL